MAPPPGERPPGELLDRVERLTGRQALGWRRATGGYTLAERWVLDLPGGDSIFVKMATTEPLARWIRIERRVYEDVRAGFLPRFLHFDDDRDRPLLVLEDLASAHWPPPWRPGDVERVLTMLEAVRATPAPAWLEGLEAKAARMPGWLQVAENPEPFLSLGLATAAWLERALPDLLASSAATPFEGDSLLHSDVRSDNLCVTEGRTLLVDWNWVVRGNGLWDVAILLPGLEAEGGQRPDDVAPEAGVFAAFLAGYFAAQAGLPPPEGAPRVRTVQLAQLRTALPWAARVLGLPEPDGRLRG